MHPTVVNSEPEVASAGVCALVAWEAWDPRQGAGQVITTPLEGGESPRSRSWVCTVGWAAPWR